MTSNLFVRMATVVLSAGLAFAGNSVTIALGGPRLGLIFDRAAEDLRPITGIPGAAITGDPLSLGFPISNAEISPAQDSALVVRARPFSVALVHMSGGDWVATPLSGVQPAPLSMAYSPGGSAAALYYRDGSVQILTGLPAAPAVAGEIDLSGLPAVTAMAVNDTGSFVLVAAGQAEPVSLFRAAPGSAPSLLGSFRSVSSVRLFNGGQQALVTDVLAETVYQISDPGGAAITQVVASAQDGIQGLVDADADAAGERVFAALGNGTILIFDRSGTATTINCGCAPTGLFRLAGPATFRLTELAGGPLEVLDASSAPRIVAVPPPAQAVALPEGRR
jgi:hypothetical protein